MECYHCRNTGKCKDCNGTGYRVGRTSCPSCSGTGTCSYCHGNSGRSSPISHQNVRGNFGSSSGFGIAGMNQGGMNQGGMNNMPDFSKMAPEDIVKYMMDTLERGRIFKKLIGMGMRNISSYGVGISTITPVLWNKLTSGTIKEQKGCAEIVGYLKEGAAGLYNKVADLLFHENSIVRQNAAEAMENLGKLAITVEDRIKESIEKETDKKIKKKLEKVLKKLKKVSPDEKQIIADEETQKRQILEDVKTMESDAKNINITNLGQTTNDFSQFKNVFFMSHALPDFPWVEKAIKEISSWPGCYCWTCERDISPGEDWLTEIYNGLDACNWYILFWSDKAKESKWTNEEMREAKTRSVQAGIPKVSIANLGNQEWPRLLSRHQGAMITSDEELQKWLENLKSMVEF